MHVCGFHCCEVWLNVVNWAVSVMGSLLYISESMPKSAKKSQKILSDMKKTKGKHSLKYFEDKPSVSLFYGGLFVFAIIAKLVKGNDVLLSILCCVVAYFAFWYGSHFDKYG